MPNMQKKPRPGGSIRIGKYQNRCHSYDLKKNTFILNSFGRPFFPQFKIDDNILHVWVVGNGDQDEMVCTIYFFVIEAIEVQFQGKIKPIQKEQDVMKVPLKTIDVKMERFQDQEFIWFQMKITSKKFE